MSIEKYLNEINNEVANEATGVDNLSFVKHCVILYNDHDTHGHLEFIKSGASLDEFIKRIQNDTSLVEKYVPDDEKAEIVKMKFRDISVDGYGNTLIISLVNKRIYDFFHEDFWKNNKKRSCSYRVFQKALINYKK
jgi:hypothetical protein